MIYRNLDNRWGYSRCPWCGRTLDPLGECPVHGEVY